MPLVDGIHKYVPTDPASPTPELLNLLGDSTRNRIAELVAAGAPVPPITYPVVYDGQPYFGPHVRQPLRLVRYGQRLIVSGMITSKSAFGWAAYQFFPVGNVNALLGNGGPWTINGQYNVATVGIFVGRLMVETDGLLRFQTSQATASAAAGAVECNFYGEYLIP